MGSNSIPELSKGTQRERQTVGVRREAGWARLIGPDYDFMKGWGRGGV